MIKISEICIPDAPNIVPDSFIYVRSEKEGHFSEWDGSYRFTWWPSLGNPPWEAHDIVRHVRTFTVEYEIIYL